MFLAENYKAIFKAILAIMIYLQNKLIDKSFEEILKILGSVMDMEIFKNTHYREYLELKNKKEPVESIMSKIQFFEDYEFVYNFKSICRQIKVKNSIIVRLENRYNLIDQRIRK